MTLPGLKGWLLIIGCWLCLALTPLAQAQTVRLEIRLRDAGGGAVVGETVTLQRLPEEEPVSPNCTTDAAGTCTWHVPRGLYQVQFTRPLDDVSALALAEGGLRGFGLTVGDADIDYHFTLQADGRIYFDAAPAAAVPTPIVPSFDALHGGTAPTPAITFTTATPTGVIELVPVDQTAAPVTPTPGAETAVSTGTSRHLLLFITLGLALGGGLHLWTRKRQQRNQSSRRPGDQATKRLPDQATTRPDDQETTDA